MPANKHGSKWIWPNTRRRIYKRDGWRCVWCQRDVRSVRKAQRTLDHVLPRSLGGTNDRVIAAVERPLPE